MENNKWPELCEQMIALVNNAQQEQKLSGEELVLLLIETFGGQILYLPKAVSFKSFVRDQQIYSEFTGSNHKELCVRYGLSEPRIYQIIDEQRKIRRAKQQQTLEFV
ncbi:hypothetical protein MMG00_10740 [Ignatzschineria rhizosphaerae]|uniref:Mor transcription activator domain-containing protein n=1 Tax=Ignatzschineria rhizosphaerae TaxID=2923279 RepID=A0ABY3X4H1_9GAMM|nr:Mor transcription activator family protein [Ignatzschineria rhizosphaerae]UNM95685.1 hypothetical protein MMG00_10740 [Ignatzschineria rhizosphaerae]